MVIVAQLSKLIKHCSDVHSKWVCYMICKLYLNKVSKMKWKKKKPTVVEETKAPRTKVRISVDLP